MNIFCIPLLQNIFHSNYTCISKWDSGICVIDFDEYYYDGILLVYVYDFFLLQKLCIRIGPITHRYKLQL